ncbi:hypothetical protein FHP05_04130 [Cerasibacillus terrae]|uniref:Uncharacterized protein n=1 Tax=Cerasibacillus terrae TaxID=2498845 RepID=A0A5C8NZM5_9BACI|nr:SE1832 family protein [Cerasibacillus terrae]TXL66581.1 hypothetical protein FHP05_04130 [Cerasibacillus terrae]
MKTKKELQDELTNLKADYARIQSDMDKLEYVKGRVSSAEEQLIRIEKEIAEVYEQMEQLDQLDQ